MKSVFDGRLEEQMHRLREWQQQQEGVVARRMVVHGRRSIYREGPSTILVENHVPSQQSLDPVRYRLFLKVLVQCSVDASVRSHISLRSTSINESALLLLTLMRSTQDRLPPSHDDDGGKRKWVATPPPSKRTCGNVYIRQLCCFSVGEGWCKVNPSLTPRNVHDQGPGGG